MLKLRSRLAKAITIFVTLGFVALPEFLRPGFYADNPVFLPVALAEVLFITFIILEGI